PLHALGGSGKKSGPDMWLNPFFHQYICVQQWGTGKVQCGGQDRSGGPMSPGKPSETDQFDPNNCTELWSSPCMDNCLLKKLNGPRPFYNLFWPIGPSGQDCQMWS